MIRGVRIIKKSLSISYFQCTLSRNKLSSFAVSLPMQRILYILVYPILWLFSKLPMRILYIKSTALFILVYYIVGYRKKVVKENLALAFPEKTQEERNKITKAFFQHLCDLIFETIKAFTISEKEIRKRFLVTNVEILDSYYNSDKSILLMAGHYGNWEWSGILNKLMKHQAHAVYKPLDNKQFDDLVKKTREHFGGIIVSNRKIVPVLFRKWKKGIKTLTYILSDQSPKLNAFKYRDTFMGIDVPMFTGTEELAKKLDFAVLYLKVEKVKRGYYTATFIPIADHPKTYEDFQITRMFFDMLETQIRENPAHYLWSHKRWKHRKR
ncbi:lysophospholipid acyltransferase family protein [Aequorivita xiaoshiensis]|uniref:Lysophospholipid acyltransferase family protein n=1 Tax=Aequorivita xiaoshiensis TaxID=2874476 RepID=A0A9X1U6I4_9FLAO|nr:lysophospholipid acyltransferase family protein [Aequorivita xiaoshiensis]MCG2431262.1 lysophospholipid acyltransferase family protein [Aequorivita xiaoshiensis]